MMFVDCSITRNILSKHIPLKISYFDQQKEEKVLWLKYSFLRQIEDCNIQVYIICSSLTRYWLNLFVVSYISKLLYVDLGKKLLNVTRPIIIHQYRISWHMFCFELRILQIVRSYSQTCLISCLTKTNLVL